MFSQPMGEKFSCCRSGWLTRGVAGGEDWGSEEALNGLDPFAFLTTADEDVIRVELVGRGIAYYLVPMASCSPARGRAPPHPPSARRMAGAVSNSALALFSCRSSR